MDLPGLATRSTPHPPMVGSGGQIITPIAAKPDEGSKKQLGVIHPVDMISSGDIIFVDHDPPLGQQPLGHQASVVAAPSAMTFANANVMEPSLPQELQQQQQQRPMVPAGGEHALGAAVPSSYSSTNGNEGIIPNGSSRRMEVRSVDGLATVTAAGSATFTAAGVLPTDSLPMEAEGNSSAPRNTSTKKASKSSPSKSSSRNASKQGKAKGKNKKKGTLTSVIANWECIGDEGVCNVCFDSESYVENPMLRCTSCGVMVHQHCYGCRSAPDEGRPWFCDPCSHGENTSTLSCALCSETGARGGAFKMVTPGIERARSWVHVSCAMWIPEVYVGSDELEPVHLEYVPKDRKTLKCVLCGKRGACVQCAGGRCLVAYHPWCLLHTDKKLEFLFRSLDPKGGLNVYCRKHIADIKVPLDLPEKDSQLGPQTYKEAHERISPKLLVYVPVAQAGPAKVGKSGRAVGKDKQGGGRSKESKKRARDNGSLDVIDVEAGPIGIRQRQTPKHPQYKEQEDNKQPRNNFHDKKRRKKSIPTPSLTQAEEPPSVEREAALMDVKDKDVDDEGNLLLHTFWDKAGAPRVGQDAGITTDKLWEVASAQFAEDHREGWLRKLVNIKHLPKDDDPIFVVPESKKKETSDQKEEDGKDGDSSDDSVSLDGDIMEDDDMGDEDDDIVTPQKDGKTKIPTKGFRSSARLGGGSDVPLGDPKVYDEEFKNIECHHQAGVLLQKGKLRAGCRFGLRIVRNNEDYAALRKNERETGVEWMRYEQPWPAGFQQSPDTFPFPGLLKAGDGSSAGGVSRDNAGVLLPAPPPARVMNGALGALEIEGSMGGVSKVGGLMNGAGGVGVEDHGHSDDDLDDIYVALSGWKEHGADDSDIRLRYGGTATHKSLEGAGAAMQVISSQGAPLPELKDDVTELLGSMQTKLKEITDRSRSKIEAIIDRSTVEVRAANDFRCYNDRVFKRLGRVQAWKSLFNKLEFGIADRPLNFNQTDASVVLDVPASWGRNAEGRQSKEEFEAQMRAHVEAANKEDAVCMVCFDGTTDDNKDIQIVYCDGCGMSVHQHCYGVKDVEADFCCERCKELRRIEDETGSADPDAVRCALCPVIHGAFKKARGNQWVHMACMLTIPGSRMDDLVNKTQIDLSEVHIDPYIVPPLLQFPVDALPLPFQQPTSQIVLSALDTRAVTGSVPGAAGICSMGFGGESETSDWQALVQAQYSGGADHAVATATTSSSAVDSTEEVDVSTPSAIYVHSKSSVLPPRRAPERELACCFCLGTEGSLLDCGITECGVGGGGVLRHGEGPALCGPCGADGNNGDGIAVCGKRFHLLCAWFAGAYVKIGATDPSFTRGERGIGGDMESWPESGQPRFGFPTGLYVEARCLEHSNGAPGRKGAPPELARVVTPAGSGGGLAAADTFVEGTTSEEQSELRSKYRFKGHPEWQLEGTKRKKSKSQMKKKKQNNVEREQQSTMRLSKPRALQPDKYERFECAVCMKSRLPMLGRCRRNTDESADASADMGAGEADAPPEELEPGVVECSGCGVRVHRDCYGVPEDISRPGTGDEWFCVPCSSRVNEPTCTLCPRKDGAFVRIRGAHYCHAFCAERTPGARLVDPVIVTEVHESTAAGGGAGTGLVFRKEEAFSDWGEVESSMTGGKASKTKASKAKVMFEELESGSLGAGEEGEDASAGGRGAGGLGGKISATKTLGGKMSRVGNGSGAGGKTAAAYAKTAETKSIPKELKKSNSKCHICSRKGGVVVPCSHARSPCERWMHPMCAAQNNRYSRRLSPEEAEASRFKGAYAVFCNDHVPPCLRHVSSGHWVDLLSLYRMRADLDRARVLFDCVLRREKIKRQLHRTSSDLFDTCLAHLRSSAAVSASAIKDRLDSIATVAAAAKVAAAAAPDSSSTEREGVGSETRRGAAVARAKEEARAAAAAAVEAAAAKAAEAANAKKAASRKGSESKIAAAIANVPWYGKYSPVEDNAVTLPEISGLGLRLRTPRAGDLGSSEYGRVRKKTLKAEEAGGHVGVDESRPFTVADAKAIAAAAGTGVLDQIGISSDDDRNGRSHSRGGNGDGDGDRILSDGRGPSGSLVVIGDEKRRHPTAVEGGRDRWPVISAAAATRRKALWEPGRRPSVGREDSHERSKAALTKFVDMCMDSVPLQGIVEGVLTAGKKGSSGRCQGSGHFGAVLIKLVGRINVKAFMEARKAYIKAHPPSKIPPPSSPQQTLRDRQLKDLCDTICEFRVPREDSDPRWESGKVKPDDGQRDLGELFDEAPSRASYPEYYAKVTNVMDLKIIKAKVLDHRYLSLDDLVADVAVMYSNAQAIEHAQAIKDGKRLFQLARRTAESLRQEEREGKTHRETLVALDESADKTPEGLPAFVGRSHKPIICVKCDKLRGNPQNKPLHKKEDYWFCESCVAEDPLAFVGHRVGVLWDGHGKWLTATITGYEPLSGKHEVLYAIDGHWEFVNIGNPRSHIRYFHPLPPTSSASPTSPVANEQHPHSPRSIRDGAVGITDIPGKSGATARGGGCNDPLVGMWVAEHGPIEPPTSMPSFFVSERVNGERRIERESNVGSSVGGVERGSGRAGKLASEAATGEAYVSDKRLTISRH